MANKLLSPEKRPRSQNLAYEVSPDCGCKCNPESKQKAKRKGPHDLENDCKTRFSRRGNVVVSCCARVVVEIASALAYLHPRCLQLVSRVGATELVVWPWMICGLIVRQFRVVIEAIDQAHALKRFRPRYLNMVLRPRPRPRSQDHDMGSSMTTLP